MSSALRMLLCHASSQLDCHQKCIVLHIRCLLAHGLSQPFVDKVIKYRKENTLSNKFIRIV